MIEELEPLEVLREKVPSEKMSSGPMVPKSAAKRAKGSPEEVEKTSEKKVPEKKVSKSKITEKKSVGKKAPEKKVIEEKPSAKTGITLPKKTAEEPGKKTVQKIKQDPNDVPLEIVKPKEDQKKDDDKSGSNGQFSLEW